MNRNNFGLWGADLGGGEFAQALAALGVIEGENLETVNVKRREFSLDFATEQILFLVEQKRPLKWRLHVYFWNEFWRLDEQTKNLWRKRLEATPANELARVWQNVVKERGEQIGASLYSENQKIIRLEFNSFDKRLVPSLIFEDFWVLEQLSRSEVGAASVYEIIEDFDAKVIWDFPIRVGLLGDAESRKLKLEIEALKFRDQPLVNKHLRIVEIKPGNSDCDVLLLPHNLRAAVAAVLKSPNALRADCVVVMGRIDETDARTIPLAESLRTQARAAGVCLAPVRAAKIAGEDLNARQIWIKELVRQITHDQPIDVALFRAAREPQTKARSPLLFAAPQLIEASKISRRLDQFRKRISQPALHKIKIPVDDPAIKNLVKSSITGRPKRTYSLNEIGEGLHASEQDFVWSHESDMATTFSRVKTTAEAALETAAAQPPPKSRWINAEIWEYRAGTRERSATKDAGVRADADYGIVVFIGKPTADSISPAEPFNDETLPPGKNEHELIVVFTEPNVAPEPKVAKIVLPRAGDSTRCEFFVRIPANVNRINARISVVYRNRILQTALLQAAVLSPDAQTSENSRIELLIESPIRPGMQDLTNRQWFDAALILNENANGTPQMTKIVNDDAELIALADIQKTVQWFDEKIGIIAKNAKKFVKLKDKKSVELLRACALNGVALYEGIMTGRRTTDAFAAAERIQLVTARNGERFPVEFVYGRSAPEDDAPLCPHAEKSLLRGQCDAACAGVDETKAICPLGFWGLNRVIERHAYDANAVRDMFGQDFALNTEQREPLENRKRLNVLTKAIVAASQNVDAVEAGSTQKVFDALASATKNQSKSVATWNDWKADIKDRSPSLLVLLPHTLKDALTGQETLEISANERLIFARLQKDHVLGPLQETHPVVILMGCKTAAPDIAYENLIAAFRNKGAALVVGTGSTILGRHAAPVVNALIKEIAEPRTGDTAFGDVLLQVRRKMMAEGLLMVLCLTSYGDTDWII